MADIDHSVSRAYTDTKLLLLEVVLCRVFFLLRVCFITARETDHIF